LAQRAQEVARSLPRVNGPRGDAHTAADVEQQRQLYRAVGLGAKIENRLLPSRLLHREVLLPEIANESSFAIANDRSHRDDRCGGSERRDPRLTAALLGSRSKWQHTYDGCQC
jgi:hypothetical protein